MAETASERVKVSVAFSGRGHPGPKKSQRRVEERLLKMGLSRVYPPDGRIPPANSCGEPSRRNRGLGWHLNLVCGSVRPHFIYRIGRIRTRTRPAHAHFVHPES